jgi:tetratricopeptide (TPR) repeat protein
MRRIAGGRPGRAPETYYQNIDVLTWDLGRWRDATLADAEASEGVGSNVGASAQPNLAEVDVRLHDMASADIALQTFDETPEPSDAALSHFVRGRMAAEAGDTLAAVTEMEAFGTAFNDPMIRVSFPGYSCWIAPAEEAAHHPDKADAILATAGTYVDCYRFRGDILDSRGDWEGAQKAYSAAVALAPDLPAGYYSWGLALARHGDLRAAEVKFQSAHEHGPRWADPLKAWGDVLARQGRSDEARDKYEEALGHAPNWAALQQAARTVSR